MGTVDDPKPDLFKQLGALLERLNTSQPERKPRGSPLARFLNSPLAITLVGGVFVAVLSHFWQARTAEAEAGRLRVQQLHDRKEQLLSHFANNIVASLHYVLEFKRTDEDLRQLQTERRQAFGRVSDMLRRYREEMPALVEQQEELQSARRRAEHFARAVSLAATRLSEISRESYEEWASALNERANRTLVHLNPSYRDLRFDTDLSFTLEEVATGRRLGRDEVDAHLSAGARDQIYLSIRLAVSDYFSAGRFRLPLILDDPFTASDDERFDRAMAFLAEKISSRLVVFRLSWIGRSTSD